MTMRTDFAGYGQHDKHNADGLEAELATERAARERAEAERDHKLDLSRVSREALEALAQACHEENEERAESARARIRAEATAPDHDADCYSLLGDGCDCGAEPAAETEVPTPEELEVLEACDDLGHAQILDIHSVDRELGNLLLARRARRTEGDKS